MLVRKLKLSKNKIESLKIHIFADGHYTEDFNTYSVKKKGSGYTYTCELWDATGLRNLITDDGRFRNAIEIDMDKYNKSVHCLKTSSDKSLDTYLATFPGDIIADIYNRYGFRLLENNVRVFLQSKGKVNKGIKDTISSEPEKFIAFNIGVNIGFTQYSIKTQVIGITQTTIIKNMVVSIISARVFTNHSIIYF